MDHECISCKYTLPVFYTYAGPHIKASCSNCGRYIKFVGKDTIPTVNESKLKIWSYTEDLVKIELVKQELNISSSLVGIHKDIAYHNLYSKIILLDHI